MYVHVHAREVVTLAWRIRSFAKLPQKKAHFFFVEILPMMDDTPTH